MQFNTQIKNKEADRDRLARDVKRFLESGGCITEVSHEETGYTFLSHKQAGGLEYQRRLQREADKNGN